MVEKSRLIAELKAFVERLSFSKKLRVDSMFLFGSQASGKASVESDVDLVIVSRDFRGKEFFERPLGLRNFWKLDAPVDFLCFTPEEFEEKKKWISSVAGIAYRTGVRIA